MATAREFWRPISNDFNPVGQVRPEDVARFFVDRKEDDPTRSRAADSRETGYVGLRNLLARDYTGVAQG